LPLTHFHARPIAISALRSPIAAATSTR
jgi:hypothetical protein